MLSGLSMNSADDVVRGMQQVRAMMGVLNPGDREHQRQR